MCSRFWLPREHTAAGLNALDHTFADVRWQKQDFVAGDDDAPFVARHRPQDFANRAFKAAAVGTSHDGRQASGTEHSAGETLRDIDVPLWSVAVGGVPCGRDDRAAAAEPSLARESLAAGELIVRLVRGRFVSHLPSKVAEARGLLAVLAKIDADFAFVSHGSFSQGKNSSCHGKAWAG